MWRKYFRLQFIFKIRIIQFLKKKHDSFLSNICWENAHWVIIWQKICLLGTSWAYRWTAERRTMLLEERLEFLDVLKLFSSLTVFLLRSIVIAVNHRCCPSWWNQTFGGGGGVCELFVEVRLQAVVWSKTPCLFGHRVFQ